MSKLSLAIVGYRGMVGQVLVDRMSKEKDFDNFSTKLFSTSQKGKGAPSNLPVEPIIGDAEDINELCKFDIILTTQGGDYTKKVFPELIKNGFKGKWIDAASSLRMESDSILLLDPINSKSIKNGIQEGKQCFVGSNCTVSLLLMGIDGIISRGHVDWISTHTYQAASGAGARGMEELLFQGENIDLEKELNILSIEEKYREQIKKVNCDVFGIPLTNNLIPWIDSEVEGGRTREEWKGSVEANKILETSKNIPIDGTCVRVGALRCHSQAVHIKLNKNISLDEVESMLKESNPWCEFVQNNKEDTLKRLHPHYVSGQLNVTVGRVRKMLMGEDHLALFTVGDQLLWGAAEPLRRALHFLL